MKHFLVHLRNITACLLVITFSYIQRSQGADFSAALSLTLAKEGGYVNNKKVRGGETYCGINRKSHRRWEGWKIIDKNHL
jgi:hypothetical protein